MKKLLLPVLISTSFLAMADTGSSSYMQYSDSKVAEVGATLSIGEVASLFVGVDTDNWAEVGVGIGLTQGDNHYLGLYGAASRDEFIGNINGSYTFSIGQQLKVRPFGKIEYTKGEYDLSLINDLIPTYGIDHGWGNPNSPYSKTPLERAYSTHVKNDTYRGQAGLGVIAFGVSAYYSYEYSSNSNYHIDDVTSHEMGISYTWKGVTPYTYIERLDNGKRKEDIATVGLAYSF